MRRLFAAVTVIFMILSVSQPANADYTKIVWSAQDENLDEETFGAYDITQFFIAESDTDSNLLSFGIYTAKAPSAKSYEDPNSIGIALDFDNDGNGDYLLLTWWGHPLYPYAAKRTFARVVDAENGEQVASCNAAYASTTISGASRVTLSINKTCLPFPKNYGAYAFANDGVQNTFDVVPDNGLVSARAGWSLEERIYSYSYNKVITYSQSNLPLTDAMRGKISAFLAENPEAKKFICTSVRTASTSNYTSLQMRKMAKAMCSYAKQIKPALSTWTQSKLSQKSNAEGMLLVTIKGSY